MRRWKNSNDLAALTWFAPGLLCALLAGCAAREGAPFAVRNAALDHGTLAVQLDWHPRAALLDALDHGIALSFSIVLEAPSPGDWLPWRAPPQAHWRRELRYFPLTRQYQLRDLDDGRAEASPRSYGVRAASIAALADLRLPLPAGFPPAWAQSFRLRVELERDRLPGALRLPALFDGDFRLSSGTYAWPASPNG